MTCVDVNLKREKGNIVFKLSNSHLPNDLYWDKSKKVKNEFNFQIWIFLLNRLLNRCSYCMYHAGVFWTTNPSGVRYKVIVN